MRITNNISALGLYAGQATGDLKEKLLDLCEELTVNVAKMRAVLNGCSVHKSYRGKKESTIDCDQCNVIFESRTFLGE